MSNLKFLFFALFLALGNVAMAQVPEVTFNNYTNVYFTGAFHSKAISGCPNTALTTMNYDIPDNLAGNTGDIFDESGAPSDAPALSGITLEVFSGGTGTAVVDFCDGLGVPRNGGFDNITILVMGIPETFLITWSKVGNDIIINIFP